jgi:hypothetical protein
VSTGLGFVGGEWISNRLGDRVMIREFSVLSLGVVFCLAATAGAQNLMANHEFELGVTVSWSTDISASHPLTYTANSTDWGPVSGAVYGNTYASLHGGQSGDFYGWVYQEAAVTPGVPATLVCDMAGGTASDNGTIAVYLIDGTYSATENGSSLLKTTSVLAEQTWELSRAQLYDWQDVTLAGTPTGTTLTVVWGITNQPGDDEPGQPWGSQNAHADKFVLTQGPQPVLTVDADLLVNGDFESRTDNDYADWDEISPPNMNHADWLNVTCSGDHGTASPGYFTFFGPCVGDAATVTMAQRVALSEGEGYLAALCWAGDAMNGGASAATRGRIRMEFYDAPGGAGNLIETDGTGWTPGSTTGREEIACEVEGIAPSGTQSVNVLVETYIPSGHSGCGGGGIHYLTALHLASYSRQNVGAEVPSAGIEGAWRQYE